MGPFFMWRANPTTHGLGRERIEWNRIMRVRSSGDTPELVMEVPRLANYACPLPPSDVCFVGQNSEDGQKTHFDAFDPVTGQAARSTHRQYSPWSKQQLDAVARWLAPRFFGVQHPGRPHPAALAPGRSGPRHRRQGLGGIQCCGLGCGWQVALRFESVTHERQPCCTWTWKVMRRLFGTNVGLGESTGSPRRTGANSPSPVLQGTATSG